MSETVTIPKEPTPGILMSMALRYDHALGLPGYYDQPIMKQPGVTHARRLEAALTTMRQLYEEVARQGFYRDDREAAYTLMAEDASKTIDIVHPTP